MPSLQTVRNALPPFRNKKEIITQWQGTDDIINEIIRTHKKYESDYLKICPLFDTGNTYETCFGLWQFLKYNLVYNEESGEEQSVKSPSAILYPGENIDCKHYSLFAGGILGAIKDTYGDNFDWCYRFATDKKNTKEATHVFVVVSDGKQEIWIDPCLEAFNYKKKWQYWIDKQPMSLVRISGTEKQAVPIYVNANVAWQRFLTCVNENYFGIKDLMKKNPEITANQVQAWCVENGFDYNQLCNFINS